MRFIAFFFILIVFVTSQQVPLGREMGEDVDWKEYDEGMKEIREKGRPGMIVFHRDYCTQCMRLGEEIHENPKFIKRSKKFVMISCNGFNDPDPTPFEFGKVSFFSFLLDGKYLPRIFFVYPNGTVAFSWVSSPLAFQYRYYYRSARQWNLKMKDFLKALHKEHVESEL